MTDSISIFALDEPDAPADEDRFLDDPDRLRLAMPKFVRTKVPADQLSNNVHKFLDTVGQVLAKAQAEVSGYSLSEITVTAEVSAQGGISILGNGGQIAGKGGLEFKFIRATS